ncbi:MAG: alpha-L-rhamnosidase [Clostridia bacterium]|nr:alpha-L-rhamnosidase [Clostridia bacterium]
MKSQTKKEHLLPCRIVKSEGEIIAAENLFHEKPLQIGLMEPELTTVNGKAYIILDYGKEICGSARILTFTMSGPCRIRLRFGESVSETSAELGEKGACNDHALRDIHTSLENYSDMTFCHTGFRFLRIDFLDDVVVNIKSILAVSEIFEAPVVYEYKGGDKRIAEIFETAKRTVSLCAQSGYIWDGIKRDRLVWIGDMYPETMSFTTIYGRQLITERSLDFVKDQTPLPGWMNGFPSYSMWWVIICADYYKKTGCKDYIEQQLDYMEGLMAQMNGCVSDDGTMNYPMYFVDWPTHDQPDELAGVRAINIMACKRAIDVLGEFGRSTEATKELLAKLLRVEMNVKTAKQVMALKYFANGELSKDEAAMLVEGGAKGLSTFMSYFILKAIAETSGVDIAVNIMKEYYGAMLDRGATTFFEDFNMEWLEGSSRIDELPKEGEKDLHGDYGAFCYVGFRHSFCHGWSAGVIMFIEEYLK